MAGRNHLIGLDKPSAISIRGMSNPWPELRRQAVGHEMNRLESVAEILGLIGILTARRFLSGHENVSAKAAFFQFGQGVRADATQAAHCLPGDLYFNSIPLRDMADWAPESLRDRGIKPLPLASKLRNLHARTDVVDQSLNTTDSNLEIMSNGRGLKHALARTVQNMITEMTRVPLSGWEGLHRLQIRHLQAYRMYANFACLERIDQYQSEIFRAKGTKSQPALETKMAIARVYQETLTDHAFEPEANSSASFHWMLRDVLLDSLLSA